MNKSLFIFLFILAGCTSPERRPDPGPKLPISTQGQWVLQSPTGVTYKVLDTKKSSDLDIKQLERQLSFENFAANTPFCDPDFSNESQHYLDYIEIKVELRHLIRNLRMRSNQRQLTPMDRLVLKKVEPCPAFSSDLEVVAKILQGYSVVSDAVGWVD